MTVPVILERIIWPSLLVVYSPLEDSLPSSASTTRPPGGDTQHLWFYNDPIGGVEIVKVVEGNESKRIPNVTFEIRRMDDALVDTVTTGTDGRVLVAVYSNLLRDFVSQVDEDA